MESLFPLVGEAWEHHRKRWRRIWLGVAVCLAVVVSAVMVLRPVGGGPAGGSSGFGTADAAAIEPASEVFVSPYHNLQLFTPVRDLIPGRDARTIIWVQLRVPARSVVAVIGHQHVPIRYERSRFFAAHTYFWNEVTLPRSIFGFRGTAPLPALMAKKCPCHTETSHVSVRFLIRYRNDRVVTTVVRSGIIVDPGDRIRLPRHESSRPVTPPTKASS